MALPFSSAWSYTDPGILADANRLRKILMRSRQVRIFSALRRRCSDPSIEVCSPSQ
jgi:hypothetical protein